MLWLLIKAYLNFRIKKGITMPLQNILSPECTQNTDVKLCVHVLRIVDYYQKRNEAQNNGLNAQIYDLEKGPISKKVKNTF
jgi:hypothetical protein